MANNAGIYKIEGPNGKVYIGSAINISSRWRKHKSLLNKNKHDNQKLQNAWNKYGADAFSFSIIQYVEDASRLLYYEQQWLDIIFESLHTRDQVLNICRTAGNTLGRKHTEESKKNISVGRKGIKPVRDVGEYSKAQSLAQKASHAKRYGLYSFISPDGDVFENIFDINLFARNHNLSAANLRVVFQGKRSHHKGWKKYVK
jgi:group I intron endonuclease